MVDGMATTTAAAVAAAVAVACALFMTQKGNHTAPGVVKGNYLLFSGRPPQGALSLAGVGFC